MFTPNLGIRVVMNDGTIRFVKYDCNEESPFQALERVYRNGDEDGPDFMVWDVKRIEFPSTPL